MKRCLTFLALLSTGSLLLQEALPLSCAEENVRKESTGETVLPFMGTFGKPEPKEDPECRAGDNAFANKDYPVAVSFYTKYLENSRKAGSRELERNAYERLLDALLLGRFTSEAARRLSEYEKRFPEEAKKNFEYSLWRGEILFQQENYQEAEVLYKKMLDTLTQQDPRYFRVAFSYGLILEKQKKFKEASIVFTMLWEKTLSGPVRQESRSFQHAVLCLAAAKDWEKAGDLLLEYPPQTPEENERYALLSAYLFLQRYGSVPSSGIWKSLLKTFRKRKDPLWYLTASSYGDAFVKDGDLALAQESYRAAFHAAGDNLQVHETLRRMVAVLSAAGDSRKAAALAMQHLELFHHAMLKNRFKLRTASLLGSAGKYKEALSLYESVFANIASSGEEKKKALYESALILGKTGRMEEGKKLLQDHLKGKDEVSGKFLLAEILVRLGQKKEFVQIYERIAARWQDQALKSRMLCIRACVDHAMPQEALAAAQKIRKEYKEDLSRLPDLFYLEGAAYAALRDNSRAAALYKEYLKRGKRTDKLYPLALYHSGVLAFTLGHHADAAQFLSRLKKEYPAHQLIPEASAWLIQAYMILNDEVSMEKETWLLASRYPDSEYAVECLFRLAQKYSADGSAGSRGKAVNILKDLANKGNAPRIQARALYELALYRVKNHQTDLALQELNKLYDSFPDLDVIADAYYLHGDILRNRSDFRNAIFFYRKVVDLQKDTPLAAAANGSVGDCLFAIASADTHNADRELKAAIAAYQQMQKIRNCPAVFDAMGYFRVGRCLEALGQHRKAAVEYLKVLYKFPAQEKALHPEALPWCVRAAEALIALARRNPLRSTLTHARTALRWLRDGEMLTHREAAERFEKLKSYQINL